MAGHGVIRNSLAILVLIATMAAIRAMLKMTMFVPDHAANVAFDALGYYTRYLLTLACGAIVIGSMAIETTLALQYLVPRLVPERHAARLFFLVYSAVMISERLI